MSKKYIVKMTGYKGTDANMVCKVTNNGKAYSHKYELGKWYEIEGEPELCQRGFHFCLHPSGPYAFYSDTDSRIFKVEAELVLEMPVEAGADVKLVAKRIRLVEEITPGNRTGKATGDWNTGDWNTGDWNTGDRNTGDWNTGDWNTGDWNTGDWNTGNWNTGNWNTGNRNTGDRNTGNWNTGDWNTGNWNTGNWNTGNWNTGNWNTGNWNTGNWNTTDRSSGFFCAEQPKVMSFDVQTDLTYEEFLEKYSQAYRLGEALLEEGEIRFKDFKTIPGITKAKLEKLHAAHLARRKKS